MNQTDPAAAPSPQLFIATLNAYQNTSALKAAIELGLFGAIGQSGASAREIAERCQCPERGIRILSDRLALVGFLEKKAGRYSLTPSSAVFLDPKSRGYLGHSVKFLLSPAIIDAFADLASTIRQGRLHTSQRGTTAPDHPSWIEFARTMGTMMVPVANGAAELLQLDPARDTKVLDISASHGTYGMAVAQKHPRAQITALDWEAVLAVTEENFKKAGLSNRFSKIVGDAFKVDLGRNYDAVLVPNFLHHFNPSDCTRFLRRVHAALRPGGQIVIIEFVPNEDRISPPAAAEFALVMLGSTPEGDAYTFSEYEKMLNEAGFRGAEPFPLPPTAHTAIFAVAHT